MRKARFIGPFSYAAVPESSKISLPLTLQPPCAPGSLRRKGIADNLNQN
jgi:hypothetical protein